MLRVDSRVNLLLLPPDIVGGIPEGGLPVLLKKMGIGVFVMGDAARSRVTISNFLRSLVVFVSLNVDAHFERLIPVLARGVNCLQ